MASSSQRPEVDQSYLLLLGQAIRAARERLGISQESFARRAHLHGTYVGRVERAKSNLTFKTLCVVLRTLGASPREFFSDIPLHQVQPRDVHKHKPLKRSLAKSSAQIILGEAVRYERELARISQTELAERAQLARSYIIGLEYGHRNPTFTVLMRILEGLAVEPADLFRHFPFPKRTRKLKSASRPNLDPPPQ